MPRYSVKDNQTGRTIIVNGDSAPSDDEAAHILGVVNTPSGNGEIRNHTIQDDIMSRQAGRPNMNAAVVGDMSAQMPKDGGEGVPLRTPLDLAGAYGQNIEGVGANAINKTLGLGLDKTLPPGASLEYGDVLRRTGLPEGAAAAGGLIAAGLTDPLQLVSKGVRALGQAGNSARKAIIRGVLPKTAPELLSKTPEEIDHMIAKGGENLTKENMSNAPSVLQGTADKIANDIVGVKKKATDYYNQAAQSAVDTTVDPKLTTTLPAAAQQIFSKEADQGHIDNILNTKVTAVPGINSDRSNVIETKVLKPGDLGPTVTQKVTSKQGNMTTSTALQKRVTPDGEVPLRSVETSSAGTPTPPAAATVGQMLDYMALGKPISTKDLVALRGTLQGLRQSSSRAGQLSDQVLEVLATHDPAFGKANAAYKDYINLDDLATKAFGGIYQVDNSAVPQANRVKAINGQGLTGYFKDAPNSVGRQAIDNIDAILSKTDEAGSPMYTTGATKYADTIKDVASAAGMDRIRPGMFGVSVAGTLGWAAGKAVDNAGGGGLGKAVSGASQGLPLLALGLGSPRVNAALIRSLKDSGKVTSAGSSWLNTPAGQALTKQIRVKMISDPTASAVVRQITGRNDQPAGVEQQQ